MINAVRSATDALGLITLATIHQPSNLIWNSFDDVLLLARGGRVTYMGESGDKSGTVLGYFTKLSEKAPPDQCNPAEFCLGVLDKMVTTEAQSKFADSDRGEELRRRIQHDFENSAKAPQSVDLIHCTGG